jgi:hypothetical protein
MPFHEIVPKLYPVFTVLLALSAGFFFYYLKSDRPGGWIIAALAFWILFGFLGASILYQSVFSETERSGLLRPASELTPINPCSPIPADAIVLLFGNSASYTSKSDQTFLRVGDVDLLSIHPKPGGMSVSAKIYSSDMKIVAQIKDNKFHLNPSNYFRRERPDWHTLEVFDQQGDRVLHVRYLNNSAIKVLGKFHSPKGIVEITEDEVLLPNEGRLSATCFGNVDVVIMVN